MTHQNLFNTLHNLYGITALESEMLEIILAVKKDEELYEKFLKWLDEENNKSHQPRVSVMGMEDRNKIIDECINKIKEMIKPNCSDHTPYHDACISCGNTGNWDALPEPDDVIEALEELKMEG